MKKLCTFLFACLLISIHSNAKIWRVNNNAGVVADFTTIQAAHDGAGAGDTIHLEPSINTYGELSMNKRLTIISTGAFIAENPGFQFDPKAPFLNSINISNAGANNSVIMVRYQGNININSSVTGVLVSNCVSMTPNGNTGCTAGQVIINNADNITIKNSWLSNIQVQNNSNNIVIANNIVGNLVAIDITSDGIVANNVIHAMAGGACGPNDASFSNSVIGNNIFNSQQNATFFNCTVSNNIAPSGNLPAGNGNKTNVDMSTVFVNNLGGYVDNVYQLKPGSPAIAAGGGVLIAVPLGGGSPFKLAATPAIPSIYKMSIPATPSGSSMTLTFSTRTNN